MLAAWKTNVEPTNHPSRKEHDLPNLHDIMIMFHVNLPGCSVKGAVWKSRFAGSLVQPGGSLHRCMPRELCLYFKCDLAWIHWRQSNWTDHICIPDAFLIFPYFSSFSSHRVYCVENLLIKRFAWCLAACAFTWRNVWSWRLTHRHAHVRDVCPQRNSPEARKSRNAFPMRYISLVSHLCIEVLLLQVFTSVRYEPSFWRGFLLNPPNLLRSWWGLSRHRRWHTCGGWSHKIHHGHHQQRPGFRIGSF